jgi:hypothetical protein
MKLLRYILAITVVAGLSSAARADSIDFHMVVLDPPPAPGFITVPIFSTSFSFTFSACSVGQLPTNTIGTYEGCFSGVNRSGQDWTNLELTFDNPPALGSQQANCALDNPNGQGADVFEAPSPESCNLQNENEYVLLYTAGAIANNEHFVIAEDGVDPSLFPEVTANITTATPEPNSIWLLATGLLVSGFYLSNRRECVVRAKGL